MANVRIPHGYAVRHPQYQELMEGMRPTVKDAVAAPYLPVAEIEPVHHDPIVIPAGTFVGFVTNENTSADLRPTGVLTERKRHLVPACGDMYRVDYSANDINSTFQTLGFVKNIDGYSATADTGATVTATGISTRYIGKSGEGIKPLGVVYNDVYASWLGTAHQNYERQPNISFLARDYVIQIPAMTTQEIAIEPGDLVVVDGFESATVSGNSLIWDPSTYPSNSQRVGRLAALSNSTAASLTGAASGVIGLGTKVLVAMEHVVGRCMRKVKVAGYASATQGDSLAATVANAAFTKGNVNIEFQDAGRVQTVPGLSLQGSGIKGVPAWARHATADANKAFWLLEIMVGTY